MVYINTQQKKVSITRLTSDKIYFKAKIFIRGKKVHYIIIKRFDFARKYKSSIQSPKIHKIRTERNTKKNRENHNVRKEILKHFLSDFWIKWTKKFLMISKI